MKDPTLFDTEAPDSHDRAVNEHLDHYWQMRRDDARDTIEKACFQLQVSEAGYLATEAHMAARTLDGAERDQAARYFCEIATALQPEAVQYHDFFLYGQARERYDRWEQWGEMDAVVLGQIGNVTTEFLIMALVDHIRTLPRKQQEQPTGILRAALHELTGEQR